MGFKVEGDLLFLAFVRQDCADEQDQTIWWNTIVQFQPLLGACDRGQHRQSVDPGLDVGRSTEFLRQHGGDTGDLVLGIKDWGISNQRVGSTALFLTHLWGNDETNHRSSGSKEGPALEDRVQRDNGDYGRHPLAASRLLISFLTFHI